MPFPVSDDCPKDKNGLLLCDEPELRSRILPLFRFDPRHPEDRVIGQGTTFRIDPWGTCLTAFHVIEDILIHNEAASGKAILRDGVRLCALELEGIGFGTFRLPEDAWRPLSGLSAPCAVESKPFQYPEIVNSFELAALTIEHSTKKPAATKYLSIDLRRWKPTIGERVLALGFADLDKGEPMESDDRAISQYLFGSFGNIIEIDKPDPGNKRAWPSFRVDASWPGGMSGGPVFNETGNVIGMVSTGFSHLEGDATATATYFSAWSVPSQYLPSIDPDNPGHIFGFAVLDEKENVVRFWPRRDQLVSWAREHGYKPPMLVGFNPDTGEWCSR